MQNQHQVLNSENEAVHQITAGDVKRSVKCDEKIALMKPDPEEVVQSALKGIQTVIENLTAKIDQYLQAIQSYVDAVSSTINNLEKANQRCCMKWQNT